MASTTLFRRTSVTERVARVNRQQRRTERKLFATIAARPQNVRNELLEMAARPS